jgi:hypothetical protein
MTLFGRSSGYYLFWTGAVYLISGISLSLSEYHEYTTFIAPVWILVLMLPFAIPQFGRWLNMDITWDKNMFNWFRSYKKSEGSVAEDMNKIMDDMNKVVKLPVPKLVPPMPAVEPPKVEPKIFYRIGSTDQNRVAFSMGQMEITMNKRGCQQMIDQLTVFMNQIDDEDEQ